MTKKDKNKKEMKTLESKFKSGMSAQEIVGLCRMSGNPGFYSGRGATLSDLDSYILEDIYTGIKTAHGINAGEEFVQMVSEIPKMSATDFLVNLYNLESNEWKWDKRMVRDESGIYVGGTTDDQKFASGFLTIASVMAGMNNRDDTGYIKRPFLLNHGVKGSDSKKRIIGDYWGGED
jgi:hypothetical protein